MPLSISELEKHDHPNLVFRCIAGSRAYGTAHEHSDTDIRGVFILPALDYLAMETPPSQISDTKGDTVYFNLKRILELAGQANPNILELLYSPQDCILYQHPAIDPLFQKRGMFMTRKVQDTYIGYARAQIKKASGQNKWVHRPQPEAPPSREKFCWFLPLHDPVKRLQAVPMIQSGIELANCRATAVSHFPHLYRLFDYSGQAGEGVFRNGKIICGTVPGDEAERRLLGLFFYNDAEYQQARRDHRHYWHWKKHRNSKRWQTQETGEIDYDAKNMMHTFRLLKSGIHILNTGSPLVRFEGDDLDLLKRILRGEFSYESLLERAEKLMDTIQSGSEKSRLPADVPPVEVDRLFRKITKNWEASHA